jgi:hypothetical protein
MILILALELMHIHGLSIASYWLSIVSSVIITRHKDGNQLYIEEGNTKGDPTLPGRPLGVVGI